MDKAVWEQKAKEADGGVLCLWIDQSSDALLKAENSRGVCLAMSRDFVLTFQNSNDETAQDAFVNAILSISVSSGGKQRIPDVYIAKQAEFSAAVKAYNIEHEVLKKQIDEAEAEKKEEVKQKLLKLSQTFDITNYGKTFSQINRYKIDGGSATTVLSTVFHDLFLIADSKPYYFLMEMSRVGGGHAVAFGYRPDLSDEEQGFSDIYQFFDANLGFFLFKTDLDLSTFFSVDVWDSLYKTLNYTKIRVICYPLIV